MSKRRLAEVEEDGDEIFTPMPEHCLKFGCSFGKPGEGTGTKLVNRKGFMVCPRCGGSYGVASKRNATK